MPKKRISVFTYLYNAWCIFWLIAIFLLLFPFILIFIQIKPLNAWGTKLTNIWADVFFLIAGMPIQIEHRFRPSKKETYVFVANHFSYLDVAVGMGIVRNYFSYMGKSSVKSIPLLGYMFAKLHIQVDRSDKNSRTVSMMRSKKALDNGRSLFIMPEGGIISKEIPKMHQPFKDGAFLLAIGSQVPIVPITFLNLYDIMPDKIIHWALPRVVIHEPIFTVGLNKDDLEDLKKKVYDTIQNEIDKYQDEHRH
ncbi:1-acyl-sn-glycerol-3-phosphate acyltransferase [Lacihabitans sp. LS3-19]|uniref:lysophospholipid acyltransferase family protein n=1 Tax=Lacihabitans sp. LS3-19 TaxID=2487335 RepID=UPI0020CCBB40|nr:lysophospholipid acyltransferase family protein [Lacihabitans sp. LS3-19]MCP9770395.1 1-acyl-sn-glycerol-3-phosphate acyltransferase [Lacihabitans sp. LS3-19]